LTVSKNNFSGLYCGDMGPSESSDITVVWEFFLSQTHPLGILILFSHCFCRSSRDHSGRGMCLKDCKTSRKWPGFRWIPVWLVSSGRTNGEQRYCKTGSHKHFSFAKDKQRKAFTIDNVVDLFNLPLSQIAFQQAPKIQQQMETCNRNELEKDVWTYSAQSSTYRVRTTYKLLMGHQPAQPDLKWLWKSYCQPKHRVFFWLLMKDRLSTKNILKRRKM